MNLGLDTVKEILTVLQFSVYHSKFTFSVKGVENYLEKNVSSSFFCRQRKLCRLQPVGSRWSVKHSIQGMSLRNNFYFLPDRWSLSPLSVQQEASTLSRRATPMVSNTEGSWILSMWVRNRIPVYSMMLMLMLCEALSDPTRHKYADFDTFSVLKYLMTLIQFCKISHLKCGNSPNFSFIFCHLRYLFFMNRLLLMIISFGKHFVQLERAYTLNV